MKHRFHGFLLAVLAMLVASSGPASAPDSAPLGSIGGVIRDADGTQPLGYTTVELVGSRRGTITDEAGRFFLPGVPPGTQHLLVRMLGFAPLRREVVVRAGETARIEGMLISLWSRPAIAPYPPGPDSTMLEDLAFGFAVRVFRLSSSSRRDPALPTPDSSYRVWNWPVTREAPPPAAPAWRDRLVALLADPASYVDPAAATKLCAFRPEVGIRLTGRDDVFELLLCFRCARLAVRGRFHSSRGGDFDARAPEWAALAREAFPEDSLLSAIGGAEIPMWTDWAIRRCEIEGADDRRGR